MHYWLYPLLSGVSLLISAALGQKLLRPARTQPGIAASVGQQLHPQLVFAGALFGALIGAKIGYFMAEWLPLWLAHRPDADLEALLFGRTVLGALLGGYAGVELVKHWLAYRTATGDTFALLAPISIGIGRIGCWGAGCCLGVRVPASWWTIRDAEGVSRWPAVPLEFAFNLLFAALAVAHLYRVRAGKAGSWLEGQLFHVYLFSYGAFRLWHEAWRDTPHSHGVSGYQALAAGVLVLGAVRFIQRRRYSASQTARFESSR